MSTLDFGLRDKKMNGQKEVKLERLFFTGILGVVAGVSGAVSIIAIVLSIYGFFYDELDQALLILIVATSSLSGAAFLGTLVELSGNVKAIAQSLQNNVD